MSRIETWSVALRSLVHAPVLRRSAIGVSAVTLYAIAVVMIDVHLLKDLRTVDASFHGLLGVTLGLLLVLRTNTSYDRWWEGRKLWGQLINDSRNLAIKVRTCVSADESEKRRLAACLIEFASALRHHLRRGALEKSRGSTLVPLDPTTPHEPAAVTARIYDQLEIWRKADQLGGFELLFLDAHAAQLMNICGACERIQKSPLSISYRWFIRQSIGFYLATLPWGLIESFQWSVVPISGLCAYFLIGIELVAEEIEDPFGVTADDLSLDEFCLTIERSVNQIVPPAA